MKMIKKTQLQALALCMGMAALVACNYGSDHRTPHPPVNPAMGGSPSESDHTNADAADLQGGYGTGTDLGSIKDDNTQRTSAGTAPAQKPDSAAKGL
jgi:hypothetical protein